MNAVFVAWQDPADRRWLPVGKLTFDGTVYQFVYTKGAQKSHNFIPFGRMTDLHAAYESHELFPLFSNRLLPESRPEYQQVLKWLNLEGQEHDPLALLGRTRGLRETDSLEVFPCPQPDDNGQYHIHFFAHGIRHLPQQTVDRLDVLQDGETLFLMSDFQNPYDPFALALRTNDPATLVGYCPRYLARDMHVLLQQCGPDIAEVAVERVNSDAPLQLRLLCSMTTCWPDGFRPCSDDLYEPLASDVPVQN
jgi:hypothetical protein